MPITRQSSRMRAHAGRRTLYGLQDAYCDTGYYYDPTSDSCLMIGTASPSCDYGYHYDMSIDNCVPDNLSPGTTIQPTDSGNPQFWINLLSAGSTAAANLIAATNAQYYTPGGSYTYGTGPYRALTPTLANQYLAAHPVSSGIGGLSTTTLLLIGGGLLALMMFMRR